MGWGELYSRIILAPPKPRSPRGPSRAAGARVQEVETIEAKVARRERLQGRVARGGFRSVVGILGAVTLAFAVVAGLSLAALGPDPTALLVVGATYLSVCGVIVLLAYHSRIARERRWAARFDQAAELEAEREAWYRAQEQAAAGSDAQWVRPVRAAPPEPVRFVRDVELIADADANANADANAKPQSDRQAQP